MKLGQGATRDQPRGRGSNNPSSSVATPVLDHANLEQNKQSFRMSLVAGFKAGFEAASIEIATKNVRMRENFRGKPRRLKLEQMHMNVYIFEQVSPSLKAPLQLPLYMGQCSFLLTVLAFRCPLSVYSQIDSGCGIKIVAVFISKKYAF